jgi:hypothetical protein
MAERDESTGGVAATVRERVFEAAAAVRAGEGPLTATELAARAQVSDATVGRLRAELERRYPRLLRDVRALVFAAAAAAVRAGEVPLTAKALAVRAEVSDTTVGALRPELETRYPQLFAGARERVLAAAAAAVKAGEGPLTVRELTARAHVGETTVRRLQPELERRYPGLLGGPRERVFAAAAAGVRARAVPLTVTALAARAGVGTGTVRQLRAELERRYPGLLGGPRERVFVAAGAAMSAGTVPLTVTALATRAGVGTGTVRQLRAELERLYPGLLGGASELVLAAAAAAVAANEVPLTATALAARARVSTDTVRRSRAELERLYPGLLGGASARVFAVAAAAVKAGELPLTALELAARAHVSKDTVGGLRAELKRRHPGLLRSRRA